MPIITGLQSSLVRDANTALATAFFPRFMRSFWTQICGSTLSTSAVEPFALDGSAPLLTRFYGTLKSYGLSSWSYQSPNLLFKNKEVIGRSEFEMDQTGTVQKRCAQIGIRVAQMPDYLLAKRILTADLTSSATTVFGNQTYNTTFENGIPLFSSAHNMYSGTLQSNIVQGGLPTTAAGIQSNDISAMAQVMLRDFNLLIDTIASIKDDKGAQLYPDLDPSKDITLVVPPILREVADLAFEAVGAILGGSPGNSGSTGSTSVHKKRVAKVLSPGLLRGCVDIESEDLSVTVSPKFATQYYAFINNDYVRPFYFQRFRPKKSGEFMPVGSDPEAEAEAAVEAANAGGLKVSVEAADVYAATEVATNLGAIGNDAQESVVDKEAFFIAGRTRGNMNAGFWPTAYKIDPSGTST